jgi:hypothetical protein
MGNMENKIKLLLIRIRNKLDDLDGNVKYSRNEILKRLKSIENSLDKVIFDSNCFGRCESEIQFLRDLKKMLEINNFTPENIRMIKSTIDARLPTKDAKLRTALMD